MKIFIPTKDRPWQDQHTVFAIRAAEQYQMKKYPVALVVETEQEAYNLRELKLPIHVTGVAGISAARQWILDHTDDEKVLMLDDDLSSWALRSGDGRYLKSTSAPAVAFEQIEDLLGNYAHAGIGHRQFANGKPLYAHCERMLRALGYRADVLKAAGIRYTLPLMEDFEMTLRLLTRGFANAVYYGVVQDQAMSGAPGGCTAIRTLELHNQCAEKLAEMFPQYVKTKQVEGWELGIRTDVSVQWKRAYHGK